MKQYPVITAKISPPCLTGTFPRKRLFRTLDRLRKRPVIWIAGPPGSGKTTLAASYVSARRLLCLWYQMDPGDEDVATFFYYLGLAAKRAMPRKRKPLPPLRPEHLKDLRSFARLYFRELFTRIKTPFVLVFDDYQEVPHDGRFHEVIRAGLDQLPERGNAIFLSRGAPPSAFARLQLNQAMAVLGEKDLHLTHEESIGVASLREEWKPHIESAGRLNDFVDGWVAGLVLMLEHSQPGDDVPECSQETTMEIFFNYFSGEIFDRLDADEASINFKSQEGLELAGAKEEVRDATAGGLQRVKLTGRDAQGGKLNIDESDFKLNRPLSKNLGKQVPGSARKLYEKFLQVLKDGAIKATVLTEEVRAKIRGIKP